MTALMSDTTPPPHPAVSYRPASAKNAPTFRGRAHRARSARAFAAGADAYDDVRPGYPPEVAGLVDACDVIVDAGAGTGKLTADLLRPDRRVFAFDPSADMVRVLARRLPIPVWRATAEATGLAEDSVDAVVCAQTWHWLDVAAVAVEFDRIVRPGGRVVLAWNTLDTTDPWILRLARIMHSGDIQRPGFYPEVASPWRITGEVRTVWHDTLTTGQIHQLTHTRSYWLRSGEKIRRRVTDNLDWYLHEHTGLTEGAAVTIPYRTDAFVLERPGR